MSLRRDTILGPEILSYYNITNRAGFGKAQIWILLTSSFLVMHVFTELLGMAIIAPASQCDLDTNDVKKSILHGSAFLGVILSSYFWNILADLKGRKWVLLLSTFIAVIISLTSSLMPNYKSFLIMRFLVGIFIAGPSFSAVTYLVEFCAFRHRRIVINYMAMFNGIGMIYCPGLAELMLCCDWIYDLEFIEYRPWRFIMILYTIPGVLGLLLMWKLPESPDFLMCAHRREEVKNILEWIYQFNLGESVQLETLPEVYCGNLENLRNVRGLSLLHLENLPPFQKTYIMPFSLSCFIMFALCSLANGLGIWFTDLRNRQIYEPKDDYIPKTICQEMALSSIKGTELDQFVCNDKVRTYRDSILLGIGFIVTYNIIGLLMQRISRKYILIISLIICGFSGIGLMILTHKISILIAFILFLAIPSVLMNLVIGKVMDFTSAHVRSKIVCICFILGRIGAIQGSILVGSLINSHCELVFLSFTILVFCKYVITLVGISILTK